jgi:hypothetical protein
VYGINGYQTVLMNLNYEQNELWPASPHTVKTWLAWLVAAQLTSTSSFLTGLRNEHIAKQLPFFDSTVQQLLLKRLRAGAQKLARTAPPKAKHASPSLTPLLLRLFVRDPIISTTAKGRLFLAATAWAIWAANRGGEILSPPPTNKEQRNKLIKRENLEHDTGLFEGCGATMTLPFDKMHPEDEISVWLPTIPFDNTCPIKLLNESLADTPEASPTDPLFQTPEGEQLTLDIMKQWTQAALHHIGISLPKGDYISSKSFRRGHSTASDRLPAKLYKDTSLGGRWSENAETCKRYVHQDLARHIFMMAEHSAQLAKQWPPKSLKKQPLFLQFKNNRKPPFLFQDSTTSSLPKPIPDHQHQGYHVAIIYPAQPQPIHVPLLGVANKGSKWLRFKHTSKLNLDVISD